MLSLRLQGGERAAQALVDTVTLAYAAPSLGEVETLITRPAATSHAGMSPKTGTASASPRTWSGLARASREPQDLIGDFAQALDKAGA